MTVKPGGPATATWSLDSANLDGARRLTVAIDPANHVPELIEQDNVAEKTVVIAPDWSRWHHQLHIEIANGTVEHEDVPVCLSVDFTRELQRRGGSGALDLNSLRVCERGADGLPGAVLPSQFDQAPGFDAAANAVGEVVWVIPGRLAPGAVRHCTAFFDVTANGPKPGTSGGVWDVQNQIATGATYSAAFTEGCLSALSARIPTGTCRQFISGLVYSSKQTGWVREEEAKLESLEVLGNGPVRATVRIRRRLRGDLTYEKTYTFYPDRLDLLCSADKAYGIISRAYYVLAATYEDSAGNRAPVDGRGDAEGVAGKCPAPKYYVMYAPDWAHSCVALSKFSNITYWDCGSAWGGIGLHGGDLAGARLSYVVHPGQADGGFGRIDAERLARPPQARIVQ
jgi:hypothetical protein